MSANIPKVEDKKLAFLDAIKQLPDEKTKTELASFVGAFEDYKDDQMVLRQMKEIRSELQQLQDLGSVGNIDSLVSSFDGWFDEVEKAVSLGAVKKGSDQLPFDSVQPKPEDQVSASALPDDFVENQASAQKDINSYKEERKEAYDKVLNAFTESVGGAGTDRESLEKSFDDLAAIQIAAGKSASQPKSPQQSKAVMLQELKAVGNLLNKASGKSGVDSAEGKALGESQEHGVLKPSHVKTAVGLSQEMANQVNEFKSQLVSSQDLSSDNDSHASSRLQGMFDRAGDTSGRKNAAEPHGSKGGR